jgi:SulP family sulfate permease
LCGIICSPPGYTDASASILFAGFGASTRWMPLTSGAVCLLVALSGDWLVSFTPKVLIAATIFLFAFKLFYDWMYLNVRNFSASDYAIVCIIFAAVVILGFMQGVLIGIILTVLVFVLRYSRIPAIQNQYSLNDQRSSVERSLSSGLTLGKHGAEAKVYTLRGYLFFGTANTIRDAIRGDIESGSFTLLLLDLRRVTGIDASAMNAFVQIKQICDAYDVQLLYSCNDKQTGEQLIALDAVSNAAGGPLICSETDVALEKMEEILLKKYSDDTHSVSVRDHLMDLLGSKEKVQLLLDVMVRHECQSGDFLFHQGDPGTGLFILESGSMSAVVSTGQGLLQRVRKFSPGSVIGELSSYTVTKIRTASVIADRPSVLYFLDAEKAGEMAVVHELVARTMGARMDNMNRRLIWELG